MTTASPAAARPDAGRGVAGAAVIMVVSIFASRVLGLVRDAIISGKFGQGSISDVYYAAFVVPDLLFFLIAGGALSSAFIPVFTEKITLGREDEAWRVFSIVASVMLVVVTAFVVVGEMLTAPLVRLTSYGFTPAEVAATVPLTRIVLPAQLCFFLGGLMMGAQQAKGRFLVPSLGPNIYNLGIIFGGLVLTAFVGVAGLCWGALLGAIVGNFALQGWALSRLGMRYRPTFNWRDPDAMRVWKLMLPVILGLALPQVSILFNRIFATSLGPGPLSALTRANMLMQAPLAIFGQALSVAIFPTLAAHAARRDWAQLRASVNTGIRFILFLTVPSSVLLILLARPVIAVILQHGRFSSADTTMTATALTCYSLGIFAWSAQAVLARGFYAMQDTVTPVVIGTLVTLVFIPMNLLFMNTLGLGYAGLALATTVAATLHMAAMLAVLRARLRGLGGRHLAMSVGRIVLAGAAAGVVCWAVREGAGSLLGPAHGVREVKVHALLTLGAASAAGTMVYGLCALALGSGELRHALRLLARRRARAT